MKNNCGLKLLIRAHFGLIKWNFELNVFKLNLPNLYYQFVCNELISAIQK